MYLPTKMWANKQASTIALSTGRVGSAAMITPLSAALAYLGRIVLRFTRFAGVYSKVSVISPPIFLSPVVSSWGSIMTSRTGRCSGRALRP